MTAITQAKEKIKQLEAESIEQAEEKTKVQKELEDLQAEEAFQKVLKDLEAQRLIREAEEKAEQALTPEDRAKEMARLAHLENIRLAESLLAIAELEYNNQVQALEQAELKVSKALKNLEKLTKNNNI